MRNEIKIKGNILDHLNALKKKKLSKPFPDRKINSIYFDTDDLDYFKDGEEGTTPRIKVRYRWYDNEGFFNGYVELKKKYSFYSIKNRHKLKIYSNYDLRKKIIKITIKFLNPTLRVSYKRKYFVDTKGNRYTLDTNISYSSLSESFFKICFKNVSYSILEIKKNIDNISVDDISTFGPNVQRYSKYCEGIKYTLQSSV